MLHSQEKLTDIRFNRRDPAKWLYEIAGEWLL
jgi:hypothetical protein